jgi:hypothetical protein
MLEKDFVQQSDPALSGQVCPIQAAAGAANLAARAGLRRC